MGAGWGRQSRVETGPASSSPAEQDGGFSISVTPGLIDAISAPPPASSKAGAGAAGGAGPDGRDPVKEAYVKGINDAKVQLRQHLLTQKEEHIRELQELESNNVTRLNEQVEAFKAKRFQAPIRPVQCTAEAANLVSCYKDKKNALECGSIVNVYQECARKVIQSTDLSKGQ